MSTKKPSRTAPKAQTTNDAHAIALTPEALTAALEVLCRAHYGSTFSHKDVQEHLELGCLGLAAGEAVQAWVERGGDCTALATFFAQEVERLSITPQLAPDAKQWVEMVSVRSVADAIVSAAATQTGPRIEHAELADAFGNWLGVVEHDPLNTIVTITRWLHQARVCASWCLDRADTAIWSECALNFLEGVGTWSVTLARETYDRLCAFLAQTSARKAA